MVAGAAVGVLDIAAQGVQSTAFVTSGNTFFEAIRQDVNKTFPLYLEDIRSLIDLRHRGLIEDSEYFEKMLKHGFNNLAATKLFEVSKIIPNVSDQVRFVVKEAYTPELITDLTQNEETPPKFIEQMQRIGVEQGAAELFWTAHYDPLGRGEFEEMFHRLNENALEFKQETLKRLGLDAKDVKFDLEFLKRMYRIRDVYPGLRNRLALLSYRPISRIDIRRLEDFGLLTKEELIFRNEEIGYSPEDSEFLARWTLINNEFKDIRALMRQNAMTKDEAIAALIEAGASAEDADRLVLRVLPIVKKEKLAKDRDLAKSELRDGFEKGILTRDEFKDALLGMSYDDDEAEFLIKLAEFKADKQVKEKKSLERNLTKADILKQFELKLTTEAETLSDLKSIGFDDKESKVLIAILKEKLRLKGAKKA